MFGKFLLTPSQLLGALWKASTAYSSFHSFFLFNFDVFHHNMFFENVKW